MDEGAYKTVHRSHATCEEAERSDSLHTPSSMITRGSNASAFSAQAQARASVTTQARSGPLILKRDGG